MISDPLFFTREEETAGKAIPVRKQEQDLQLKDNLINIGSRQSQLAVLQSEIVASTINKYYPDVKAPVIKVSTLGDQVQSKPLYTFGGKSLWTKELEVLLLESVGKFPQVDMISHSLKDMPTILPDSFELGCILEREDPRDAFVAKAGSSYKKLADLPDGSIVGTSSVRRSAQLLKKYPNLNSNLLEVMSILVLESLMIPNPIIVVFYLLRQDLSGWDYNLELHAIWDGMKCIMRLAKVPLVWKY